MSRFQSQIGLIQVDGHPCSVEDVVAGLLHVLSRRLHGIEVSTRGAWLVAMSDVTNEVKQDAQQTIATIRAAQSGSSSAYGKLVGQYQQCIAIQMRRFTRDRRLCEELTHDVFVEAYFSLHSFRFNAPFHHWLSRIAVRVGYRFWKTQKREAGFVSMSETEIAASSSLHMQSIRPTEAADLVHWLLSQLSPSDRLVLTVIYLDGCSIKEAAFRCSWTMTGTKLRLFRARRKMLALLKEHVK